MDLEYRLDSKDGSYEQLNRAVYGQQGMKIYFLRYMDGQ